MGAWANSSQYTFLTSTQSKGTVMVILDGVQTLKRAWCIFDVLQTLLATKAHAQGRYSGLTLCTASGVLKYGGVGADIAMTIAKGLAAMDLRQAQSSNEDDARAIRASVE